MKQIQIVLFSLALLLISQSCVHISFGWKDLFGKNFREAEFEEGSWEVQDDILVALEDKVVWASGEYENFRLFCEFMNEEGTNSGVIVYCTDKENWIPNSVEVQIADDHSEKVGEARKDFQCGAIFGHLPAEVQKVVYGPGEWNEMEITCKGQRIEVVLNGQNVTSMDMTKWTSGTTNPDGSEIPNWLPTPFAKLPTRGYIGFQGKHGDSSIWFRNVKIKAL